MNNSKIVKGLGIFLLIIGLLLLGRALSEGNSDTGRFYVPLFMIAMGVITLTRKNKDEK